MPTFNHILFPVDFSERCRAIRPSVVEMAHRFKARITLLHVLEIPVEWYGPMEGLWVASLDIPAIEKDTIGELGAFLEPAGPEITVACVTEQGNPAARIASFAEKHDVDLIMMATHGYGTFRSLLLGSMTAKVLHEAKCAVWTSAHMEDPSLASRPMGQSMVCAIDGRPDSVGLIRFADDFARQCDAKLRLIHAVAGTEVSGELFPDMDFKHFLLQSGRDTIAKLQKEAGTSLDAFVEAGNVSSVVREAAQKLNAGLVIMGRGGIHQPLGRLRSNAYAIVRDSPCPVLSI